VIRMRCRPGTVHGVLIFEPFPHSDERGFFTRTFDADVAAGAGLDVSGFVQDSQSRSWRGVVRGMHVRKDGGEAKLVRCSFGAVHDVAVDLRPWSPTYLRQQAIVLDDVDHRGVYLPPGLAHGFQALSEVTDVCYRIDAVHRPEADVAIAWDDPDLAIQWPLPATLVSKRDRMASRLADVLDRLPEWFPAPADDLVGTPGLSASQGLR
jgi:dTDP-4-dehydrorhamnose 3,5-epimerase